MSIQINYIKVFKYTFSQFNHVRWEIGPLGEKDEGDFSLVITSEEPS